MVQLLTARSSAMITCMLMLAVLSLFWAPQASAACAGSVGGVLPLDDYDNDGYCNIVDLDNDNDGILDTVECPSIIGLPFQNAFNEQTGVTISGDDNNNVTYSSSSGNGNNNNWATAVRSSGYAAYSTLTDYSISYTVAGNLSGYVVFGINDSSTTPSFTDINHGIRRSLSSLSIIENGASVTGVPPTSVALGDVLSIRKVGTVILYQKNGVTFYTSLVPTPLVTPQNYLVDISFLKWNSTTSTLNNINIDFGACGIDTDGDGITNDLDLDSDGDGCPDALEGDGGYVFTDLVEDTNLDGGNTGGSFAGVAVAVQQNLGNAANEDGTPNIEGTITTDSEPQGLGGSNDGAIFTACCADAANFTYLTDTDSDGIGDACDLDDDNDGIPDIVECELRGLFDFNNFSGTALVTRTYSETQEGVRMRQTSSGTVQYRNYNRFSGVLMNTSGTAYFVDYAFSEDINIKSVTFNGLDGSDPVTSLVRFYDATNALIPFSSTPSIITSGGNVTVTFSETDNVRRVRFYREGYLSGDNFGASSFNNLEFVKPSTTCVDSDLDGIVDQLDLDSDGDGCPDALEGDGGFTVPNLFNDTNIPGGNTSGAGTYTGSSDPIQYNLGTTAVGMTVDTDTASATFGFPIVPPNTSAIAQGPDLSRDSTTQSAECTPGWNDTNTGVVVSGQVYVDTNNSGTKESAEAGIGGTIIVLRDQALGSCRSVSTTGSGHYYFTEVPDGNYDIYQAHTETSPVPQNCGTAFINNPVGYQSTTVDILNITVANAEITDQDFGEVATSIVFAPNHQGVLIPGNTTFYAHTLTANAESAAAVDGGVRFMATGGGNITSGWTHTLYRDTDCNGALNGIEGNATINGANLSLAAAAKLCIINKVYAPADAPAQDRYNVDITATFTFPNRATGPVISPTAFTVTDLTVTGQDGGSRLALIKTVENLTQSTPETSTLNQGEPGDILKYRIYYHNIGDSPIISLKINDSVPKYTGLVGGSPLCNTPLVGMTCTPVLNNDALEWLFTGLLVGGARGHVSYEVAINN